MKKTRIIHCLLTVLVFLFSATFVYAQDDPCLPRLRYSVIHTPESGFKTLLPTGQMEECDSVPVDAWERLPCGDYDLMVHTAGPGGSMREWDIFVGFGPKNGNIPTRGFCLSTFTLGWRQLQTFHTLPLPWIQDRDHDGKAELIIWSSFPLREEASLAEYGIIAWVYKADKKGNFTFDLDSSRSLASEIASVYREPLEGYGPAFQQGRIEIAEWLERFATGKCKLNMEKIHR
jgi:hypothetical protein